MVSEAAARFLARWPNVACLMLLEPSLALTDNDKPLYTSQPYECTFRDYTPSLGLYGGGGTLGGGTAAAAALRTPAFLLTQVGWVRAVGAVNEPTNVPTNVSVREKTTEPAYPLTRSVGCSFIGPAPEIP